MRITSASNSGSRPAVRTRPSQALSSSTSPYASTRGSSLRTRVPSNSAVSPESPVRVYSFIVRIMTPRPTRASLPAVGGSTLPVPAPAARRRFRARLLTWYRTHGRDLPWRRTDDPYHILVSEIMLQQTQVERVLPKYAEWLEKYPSLRALASAPEGEVNATWYP